MGAQKTPSPRSVHRCQSCGHVEPKWLGRCPACGEWNTLVEELPPGRSLSAKRIAPGLPGSGGKPIPLAEVSVDENLPRLACGIAEVDRVLGGGLVPGSLVLLGGDPGIGKSTLLLQALDGLARAGRRILYVSGEESVAQAAMRAHRLGVSSDRLFLYSETSLEKILAEAGELRPDVLAVDSIQTVHTEAMESIPGSVGQVRECAARLLTRAKTEGTAVILVGHVTKDGAIAGPKTLEHVVDAVLQFEGEGTHAYRVLRALKNRFGSTSEIGVFEMHQSGLSQVESPSALFLAERHAGSPGSVVVASADGSRPILVEVQALVAPASAGIGRRTANGVDVNRVALLLAVLAERAGVGVLDKDVFVNIAGGLRLSEPAIDLGIACAIASAARRVPLAPRTLVFGEVGLAGELRGVPLVEPRLIEAKKLGFERVLLPRQNRLRGEAVFGAVEVLAVDHLRQALDLLGVA
ncbi:MAG: DNA repair protein RadA [Deltaproteobacteria bacterium]|nr:DNA repair protein RadA [Deltaproteobacteria bacterium]